jgi:hypothetical protein
MSPMKRLLREPLVHFLALGAALFVIAQLTGAGSTTEPSRRVMVTQGQVERLLEGFRRTWMRPPTRQELDGLINDFIQEEIFYREALALGLDREDAIIRRRLRQKMEFLSEDLAELVEPTDQDLEEYLSTHADDFRRDTQYRLAQVYVSVDRHGAAARDTALRILEVLRQRGTEADVDALGDRLPLPRRFDGVSERELAQTFGQDFAAAVGSLEPGAWQGPVPSGFGLHLVVVAERIDGTLPSLDEVRDQVAREWGWARQQEVNERLYQGFRDQYVVTVEWPDGLVPDSTGATR